MTLDILVILWDFSSHEIILNNKFGQRQYLINLSFEDLNLSLKHQLSMFWSQTDVKDYFIAYIMLGEFSWIYHASNIFFLVNKLILVNLAILNLNFKFRKSFGHCLVPN